MPLYRVTSFEVVQHTTVVEADNQSQALYRVDNPEAIERHYRGHEQEVVLREVHDASEVQHGQPVPVSSPQRPGRAPRRLRRRSGMTGPIGIDQTG